MPAVANYLSLEHTALSLIKARCYYYIAIRVLGFWAPLTAAPSSGYTRDSTTAGAALPRPLYTYIQGPLLRTPRHPPTGLKRGSHCCEQPAPFPHWVKKRVPLLWTAYPSAQSPRRHPPGAIPALFLLLKSLYE